MFELLVPPEPHQLDAVGGDADRYDHELRPGLMVRAIQGFQTAGVEPAVWKLEGLETREDHEAIAAAARGGGRDRVGYVVLGRGADLPTVERWLRAGVGVDGFRGFAVGRSIWWEPCRDFFDAGATDEAADRAAAEIDDRYRRLVDVFGGPATP
jgi:myo-inositol catabolism protein IolC